eukprot:s471_g30.t1
MKVQRTAGKSSSKLKTGGFYSRQAEKQGEELLGKLDREWFTKKREEEESLLVGTINVHFDPRLLTDDRMRCGHYGHLVSMCPSIMRQVSLAVTLWPTRPPASHVERLVFPAVKKAAAPTVEKAAALAGSELQMEEFLLLPLCHLEQKSYLQWICQLHLKAICSRRPSAKRIFDCSDCSCKAQFQSQMLVFQKDFSLASHAVELVSFLCEPIEDFRLLALKLLQRRRQVAV